MILIGTRGKKKTLNIYPLEIPTEEVEIKLVMAQLNKNIQIQGKFYSIFRFYQSLLHDHLRRPEKNQQYHQGLWQIT